MRSNRFNGAGIEAYFYDQVRPKSDKEQIPRFEVRQEGLTPDEAIALRRMRLTRTKRENAEHFHKAMEDAKKAQQDLERKNKELQKLQEEHLEKVKEKDRLFDVERQKWEQQIVNAQRPESSKEYEVLYRANAVLSRKLGAIEEEKNQLFQKQQILQIEKEGLDQKIKDLEVLKQTGGQDKKRQKDLEKASKKWQSEVRTCQERLREMTLEEGAMNARLRESQEEMDRLKTDKKKHDQEKIQQNEEISRLKIQQQELETRLQSAETRESKKNIEKQLNKCTENLRLERAKTITLFKEKEQAVRAAAVEKQQLEQAAAALQQEMEQLEDVKSNQQQRILELELKVQANEKVLAEGKQSKQQEEELTRQNQKLLEQITKLTGDMANLNKDAEYQREALQQDLEKQQKEKSDLRLTYESQLQDKEQKKKEFEDQVKQQQGIISNLQSQVSLKDLELKKKTMSAENRKKLNEEKEQCLQNLAKEQKKLQDVEAKAMNDLKEAQEKYLDAVVPALKLFDLKLSQNKTELQKLQADEENYQILVRPSQRIKEEAKQRSERIKQLNLGVPALRQSRQKFETLPAPFPFSGTSIETLRNLS